MTQKRSQNFGTAERYSEIISGRSESSLRWGVPTIGIIISLIVTASFVIEYPEVVRAEGEVIAFNTPKKIIINQNGKLVRLFCANKSRVKEGQIIGWIESTTNYEQAYELFLYLDTLTNIILHNKDILKQGLTYKHYTELGQLQEGYNQFIAGINEFNDYTATGFYSTKKNQLEKELDYIRVLNTKLQRQDTIVSRDVELGRETYAMNKGLFEEKVISKEDLRKDESRQLIKEISKSQIDGAIISNLGMQKEKEKEINELVHYFSLQQSRLYQKVQSFRSQIQSWVKEFAIISPTEGEVVFVRPTQENDYLSKDQTFCYVNFKSVKYEVQLNLNQTNFGRVALHQPVQLRLDAFPYEHFGVIEGEITFISDLPTENGFLSTVQIHNPLLTDIKQQIKFDNGMKVSALIITKKITLARRIIDNLNRNLSLK